MKCLVCGKTFENIRECPMCGFPVVEIAGDDFEAGIKALAPTIDRFRKDLAAKTKLGLVTYRYSLEDGKIIDEGENIVPLGDVSLNMGKEQWLRTEFENVRGSEGFSAEVEVTLNNNRYRKKINVVVEGYSETFTVGFTVSDNFELTFLLKGNADEVFRSAPVPLFDD